MSSPMIKSAFSVINTEFERHFIIPKPDRKILADPVQSQLDAYNAHDLGRFLSCFADDTPFEGDEGETLFRGHKQMYQVYSGIFAAKKIKADVTHRCVIGQWVADHQVVQGLSGRKKTEVLVLYRVEEGLIRHVKLFR